MSHTPFALAFVQRDAKMLHAGERDGRSLRLRRCFEHQRRSVVDERLRGK
jgi:hypothetical protein